MITGIKFKKSYVRFVDYIYGNLFYLIKTSTYQNFTLDKF